MFSHYKKSGKTISFMSVLWKLFLLHFQARITLKIIFFLSLKSGRKQIKHHNDTPGNTYVFITFQTFCIYFQSSCRNRGSVKGYFLAGRSMHWIPVCVSFISYGIHCIYIYLLFSVLQNAINKNNKNYRYNIEFASLQETIFCFYYNITLFCEHAIDLDLIFR